MAGVTKKHFEREHSDFLRKVANEVYELVRNPETMTRFRERIRIFCEKNEENQREVEQLKKDSKADPKLQVSIKNLEKKTWGKTWDEMTDEERTQVDFEELLGTLPEGYENYVWDEGFCISPKTANLQIYLTPPTDWGREIDWRFWEYQATAASDDDKIISCYALLVAIHDTRISEKPIYTNKVYNGSWRLVSKWIKQLYQNCLNIRYPWEQDSFDGGEDVRDWITRALNDVKADLASLDKVKKMPEAKIEVGQNKSQPTKDAVARIGNADKEIWQMEEIAKSLVEWIGESQYEFKHEGEKFWQDYFERPYERNYDIFMQLQIMLLHVIDRSNFNRLIEWLKWYKSQIGKDLDEQRIKIRSECISVCESNLNLDNEKLNLRLIDSIHKIEGYTDELAKSLLNIARIMKQESQTDRTEIANKQTKTDLASTKQNLQKQQRKQVITHNGFMNLEQLCKQFNVPDKNKQAFRKRLERFRKKNALDANAFTESQNKGVQQSKYLYNVKMIASIAEEVKGRAASLKRPSEKKTKKN